MDLDHIKTLNTIAQSAAHKLTILAVPEIKKHIHKVDRKTTKHPQGSEGYWFQMGVKHILLDAAMAFPDKQSQMYFLLMYNQRRPKGTILVETD